MEIRNQSRTGPVVPPLAELTATLSHQIDDMKQRLLDRLKQDPASFVQIEADTESSNSVRPYFAGRIGRAR